MFWQIPRCLGSWSAGPSRSFPDDTSWARGGHTALGSGGGAGGPGIGGRLLGGPGTRSWEGLGRPVPRPQLGPQGRPVTSHSVGELTRLFVLLNRVSGRVGAQGCRLACLLPGAWIQL